MNLADLTVYNLTSDPAFDGAPAWSPDGSTIAFVSDRTGIPELYRVNDDGTGLVRLTTAIGFNGRFAWSPDGRTIALAREVLPASRISTASMPMDPASSASRPASAALASSTGRPTARGSCSTARPKCA